VTGVEALDRLEEAFGPLEDVDPDIAFARAQNPGELPVIDRTDGTWF
jgi:hypothetical protein